MKKVNVILSTYNGEKYLSKQLDSILNQTYGDITIYIRDDGSNDSTVDILEKYRLKYSLIKIIKDDGSNLGYVKSFLKIIRLADEADYYAFCDQDDYWLPDKIERAVKYLETVDKEKPALYTSAYAVCDEELNIVGKWHRPTEGKKLNVGRALSLYDGGWLLGFTCVFNKKLKNMAFDNDVTEMYSHDIWTQAVNTAFNGKLIIDDKVTAYFRRHLNTTSIAESSINQSFWKMWKYRWDETFGKGKLFSQLKKMIISFDKVYEKDLRNKEDILFVKLFGNTNRKFSNRIRKIFYPYRLKKQILLEVAWRIAILFNRL